MITLTNEDREKLQYDSYVYVKKVDLSAGSFYAKFCNGEEMFKELLGKKIFDIVGIKCPNYYLISECRCILSNDLNSYKGFNYARELGISDTNLSSIRGYLEEQRDEYNKYNNVEELMFKVNIMHFIDILFSNIDRHTNNYGLILNDDGSGELVVFDNGLFLNHLDKATRPVSFNNAGVMDFCYHSKYAEARCFFDSLSDDEMMMIKYLYSVFDVRRVKLIMNSIERDVNQKFKCKKELIKKYKKNYLMIGKLFLIKKLSRKKKVKSR